MSERPNSLSAVTKGPQAPAMAGKLRGREVTPGQAGALGALLLVAAELNSVDFDLLLEQAEAIRIAARRHHAPRPRGADLRRALWDCACAGVALTAAALGVLAALAGWRALGCKCRAWLRGALWLERSS
jgi:hypothetical protein